MAVIFTLLQAVLSGHIITAVLIGIVSFLVSLAVVSKLFAPRRKNPPPGPPGWPVLGNLLSLAPDPHLQLTAWRRKYGDVFSIKMGPQETVVVSGSKAMKEALVEKGKLFSSRPDMFLIRQVNHQFGIILSPYGDQWKAVRRFSMSTLRFLGMGTGILEKKIQEECHHLRSELQLHVDQPVDLKLLLQNSVSNIICSMSCGKRFEYGDPMFKRLQELAERGNELFYEAHIINIYPVLRFFPGISKIYQECLDHSREVNGYFKDYINQHKATPDEVMDLIDAFNKKQQDNPGFLPEQTLPYLLIDLFSAGTETVATTLRWGFLYLMVHPDVQEKVQVELDQVVGRDRPPAVSDRPNLPYTEATILEMQRIRTVTPLSVPHCTSSDTTLLGYDIPAGTDVLFNLWSLHMDPSRWKDPEKFDPTRFLDDDGQPQTNDAFMPFGAGPRVCLGEHLAKMELFLFLTNILQQFTLKLPQDAEPDFHGILRSNFYPRPYDLILISRD